MLDLQTTLLGGQAFNWDFLQNNYYGFTQSGMLKVSNDLMFETFNDDIDLNRYLSLDFDQESLLESFKKDRYVIEAIMGSEQINILRQPFIQTTLSYILATNKNIVSIRNSVRLLGKSLGKRMVVDGIEFYTFPMLEDIADADIDLLMESKIGYRAKYLKESARRILDTGLDGRVKDMSKEEIRSELISLPGIGPKVADCILLYSLNYLDVVPIDVWMGNIARDMYGVDYKRYDDISNWYRDYFGEYAGIAGQYLFEYYRKR